MLFKNWKTHIVGGMLTASLFMLVGSPVYAKPSQLETPQKAQESTIEKLFSIFNHHPIIDSYIDSYLFAIKPEPDPIKIIDRHALSLLGDIKYPENFKHFDYVNPHAPKGGSITLSGGQGFDTLNYLNGKGDPAIGLNMLYDTLMTGSMDEPASEYGLLARRIRYPDDYAWVEYDLRLDAKWQDGKAITVDDVIFSLNLLKKQGNPSFRYYYANVVKAKKVKDHPHTVRFIFNKKGNRELPLITGQFPILPKHYWQDKDFSKPSMVPPLGSGAYKIDKFIPNRSITYIRNKNYWGKDLPVNKGMYNIDKIRFEMYRDSLVEFEAFKSGNYDFRIETSAKNWEKGYNFRDAKAGLVQKTTFQNLHPKPMQGLLFNLRRPQFKDPIIREAIGLTLDFAWLNHNLFFDSYKRSSSFFEQSELESKGLPKGTERTILEGYGSKIPAEIFTQKSSANNQLDFSARIRKALSLLKQAGYVYRQGQLFDQKEQKITLEILNSDPFLERVFLPIAMNIKKIGIPVIIRTLDSAQYIQRLQTYDFDMVMTVYPQSSSPGNEQRQYWGSEAAGLVGSRNYAGVQNPVIDDLIEKLIFAKDREQLVAATKALDRMLQWQRFMIPLWYAPEDRIAYRSRFGFPDIKKTYGAGGQISLWWAKTFEDKK